MLMALPFTSASTGTSPIWDEMVPTSLAPSFFNVSWDGIVCPWAVVTVASHVPITLAAGAAVVEFVWAATGAARRSEQCERIQDLHGSVSSSMPPNIPAKRL